MDSTDKVETLAKSCKTSLRTTFDNLQTSDQEREFEVETSSLKNTIKELEQSFNDRLQMAIAEKEKDIMTLQLQLNEKQEQLNERENNVKYDEARLERRRKKYEDLETTKRLCEAEIKKYIDYMVGTTQYPRDSLTPEAVTLAVRIANVVGNKQKPTLDRIHEMATVLDVVLDEEKESLSEYDYCKRLFGQLESKTRSSIFIFPMLRANEIWNENKAGAFMKSKKSSFVNDSQNALSVCKLDPMEESKLRNFKLSIQQLYGLFERKKKSSITSITNKELMSFAECVHCPIPSEWGDADNVENLNALKDIILAFIQKGVKTSTYEDIKQKFEWLLKMSFEPTSDWSDFLESIKAKHQAKCHLDLSTILNMTTPTP